MDTEECGPVAKSASTGQHSGRSRKRGGLMSSSIETQVGVYHAHDKVLRSHTRRGRGSVAPSPTILPIIATSSSRRRQRSSGCSSQTDEDDGGGGGGPSQTDYGEVSVSVLNYGEDRTAPGKGKGDEDGGSDNTSNSGSIIITMSRASKGGLSGQRRSADADECNREVMCMSSSCNPPTNETKELCEQAGLLGGTSKTTTIHSGGTRLSSSCMPTNNDPATQQCGPSSTGEMRHSSRETASINCSQNVPPSRCRSRQQSNHRASSERASSPAPSGRGDEHDELSNQDNRPRPNSESSSNGNDDLMCGEDAVQVFLPSCELPGRRNTSVQLLSTDHERQLSQSRIVGALSSSVTITTVVKSEGAQSDNETGGTESKKRTNKDDSRCCPSVSVVRVKRDIDERSTEKHIHDGEKGEVSITLNKLINQDDGRWSGQGKFKDGAKSGRKGVSVSSSTTLSSVASMPQKAGVNESTREEDVPTGSASEQSNFTKTSSSRQVKKCSSKKQNSSCPSSLSLINNNNLTINPSGLQTSSKSVSVSSAGGKKASVPAPMLLMNNLPYMGELTFDTRPRRGRKPKKADICHLISKNYGIHFPAGVTQAAPASIVPTSSSTKVSAQLLAASSKKQVSDGTHHKPATSRSTHLPPAFSNRDVSIVPIIPTAWPGNSHAGRAPQLSVSSSSTKPSSTGSPVTVLNPLTCLAQHLMLQHHKNTPRCSPPSQSPQGLPSSTQQTISMFPLMTPSSFSQAQYGQKEAENSSGSKRSKVFERESEDDDDSMMEVDIECHSGKGDSEDGTNQESPLNLCMRDESMVPTRYHESLDVRWCKSGGEATSGASKRVVRSVKTNCTGVYYSDGANESGKSSSKRNIVQTACSNNSSKRNKSGKVVGRPGTATGSYNYCIGNSNTSESLSNLVTSSPSQFGSGPQASSKFSPNIFAISAHHLQTGSDGSGKPVKVKQGGRKKKELSVRGDVSVAPSASSGSGVGPGSSSTGLSSFGGTLFGQSTGGLNDTAEVSICKFKFTGGAKPCLQEKKMLSVDSGGNLRFYSDKTSTAGGSNVGNSPGKGSRGPGCSTQSNPFASSSTSQRTDTNQSPPSIGESGECLYALSSLPKSAKSMSMCMPIGSVVTSAAQMNSKNCSTSSKLSLPLVPSTAGVNPYAALSISPTTEELQQLHLSMQDHANQSRSSSRISPFQSGDNTCSSSNSCSSSDFGGDGPSSPKSPRAMSSSSNHRRSSGKKLKRKRRTRKSLMREKLEKTFKEKGFLIQTQQLESAEGATYCKFRQLRKFTRYLFRSWKDYLPDHVKQISDNNANNGAGPSTEQGTENAQCDENQEKKEMDLSLLGGDVEEDTDEEDNDEEDDADSEEQPGSSLISCEKTLPNKNDSGGDEDVGGAESKEHTDRYNARGPQRLTASPSDSGDQFKVKIEDEGSNKEDDEIELEVDA